MACRTPIKQATQVPCGSELARECIGSGNEDVECAALFASKLAPTLDFACRRDLAHAAKTCGSEPARECIGSGNEGIECPAAFASRLAPTLDFACRRDLAHAAKTCGSELAREGIRSGDEILNVPPSSRAGSLPQGSAARLRLATTAGSSPSRFPATVRCAAICSAGSRRARADTASLPTCAHCPRAGFCRSGLVRCIR